MSAVKETKEVKETKQYATIQTSISPTSPPNPMRELLRPGYAERATLSSILFKDHTLPIHEVHFTIDEYDEEQEKAKLRERLDERDEKESKPKGQSDRDAKADADTSPRDAWSSSLYHQRGGENARQPVSVADIFKPRQQLTASDSSEAKSEHKAITSLPESAVHRVLILGQAGSGKTTLSKYLADAWAKDELWPLYNQLFWINARDMHSIDIADLAACAASPFPLAALIHRLCFTNDNQRKIGIKAIERLLKTQAQQTLVILDGFDEVAQVFSENTETAKPFKVLLTAVLNTNCDLIVTSRDYSRPPSNIKFDRQLVNQGFSDAQVSSYIQRYFTSLSKPDAKLATEVQQLVQRNYRLWTHAHNPLILSLTCDYYRNASESQQKKLEKLTLLDLYENSLAVFIRRYLDHLSQQLKKPEFAWESTKDYSLDQLIDKCPVEVDFLQKLSFLGIREGVQRFEKNLKKEAIAEVRGRYEKAGDVRFTNALKLLGLIHEFPSEAASSLDKVHEFVHLTFQEFLAARHIAGRLQHHEPKACEWLRSNKYNPSYREVLNFICTLMPAKRDSSLAQKYASFWEILLEEQTDRTGVGHLQLLMYSLEAAQCDSQIPKLHNYIDTISQALIGYVKAPKLEGVTWLLTTLEHSPHVLGQLKDDFWQKIVRLLQIKETATQVSTLLLSMMRQAQQFMPQRREWLLAEFLRIAENKEEDVRCAAIDALEAYSAQAQAAYFPPEARSQLLTVLVQAAGDNAWRVSEAAIRALKTYSARAARFPLEARGQLLTALLQAAKDEEWPVRCAAIEALGAYSVQTAHLSPEAHDQLLMALLQAAGDKNGNVHSRAIRALLAYNAQVAYLLPEVRDQLLTVLLQAARNKKEKESVREAAICALGWCGAQAVRLLPEVRNHLLTVLLQAAGDEEGYARAVAIRALGWCGAQAVRLLPEVRDQLLTALLQAAGDKEENVRRAAIHALEACGVQQAAHFLPKTRNHLLTVLLQAAMNKKEIVYVREAAIDVLKTCVAHAVHFPPEARDQLLTALLQAAEDKEWEVRDAAIRALEACGVQQAAHFLPKTRNHLLTVLLQAVGDKVGSVRYAAIRALKAYNAQVAHFSPEVRNHLLTVLLQVAMDKKEIVYVREAAIHALEACGVQQAAHFLPKTRDQLLTALLQAAGDKERDVRAAAIDALKTCVAQAAHFPPEACGQLLKVLLHAVCDKDWRMKKNNILNALNAVLYTCEDWLRAPYSESFAALKQLLVEGKFLVNIPLNQLLKTYFTDQASGMLGSYPRRELWLQFVVARVIHDGVSITIKDDQCHLYGASLMKLMTVPIPQHNRAKLIQQLTQALTLQAKTLALPVFAEKVPLTLPTAIQYQPRAHDSIHEATEAEVSRLAQEKIEGKIEKLESRVDVHDQRLAEHDQRLQQIENTVRKISLQVEQHDAALATHQKAIDTLKDSVSAIETSMEGMKAEIKASCQTLEQQAEALANVKQQIAELQTSATQQGKTLAELGEHYTNLQEQQTKLEQACEKNQQALLAQYEKFSSELQQRLEALEKSEAKQEAEHAKQCRELQEKQAVLEKTLEKVQADIQTLEKTDAHTAKELDELQTRQAKLMALYQKNQDHLAERQTLLAHPKLTKFYRTMHIKLSGFFMVCTVAATGLVKIESQASLGEQIAQKLIGTLGDNIPVPGAKAAASFINKMISWHSAQQAERRQVQGAGEGDLAVPVSFGDKEAAIDLAVCEIIRRYGQHICVLKDNSVVDLAKCAVNRIANGIEKASPPDAKSASEEAGDINFPLQMVNFLHAELLRQGTLGHKELETEKEIRFAPGQKPWNEDGIFRRTGIRSSTTYFYTDKATSSFLGDKPLCRYKKYGFRMIADHKQAAKVAEQQGFKECSAGQPVGSYVISSVPLPALVAPKKAVGFFGQVTAAAEAVGKDEIQGAAQNIAGQIAADPQIILAPAQSVTTQAGTLISGVSSSVVSALPKGF
jgi:HEAT repeat protein/archaellum component FlaC/nucleoside-triphosphatase THEP1